MQTPKLSTSKRGHRLVLLLGFLSVIPIGCARHNNALPVNQKNFTRTQDETSRIWFAPFVDEAGNQHEASYVNVVISSAKWAHQDQTKPATPSAKDTLKDQAKPTTLGAKDALSTIPSQLQTQSQTLPGNATK